MGELQAWITILGSLFAAVFGILKYFNYRSRRDRLAAVGAAFNETVDAMASDSTKRQLAAAILLRRFFDADTEQGEAGAPYQQEAIAVIAALLRGTPDSELQKLLGDGLAFAPTLRGADLQGCNLSNCYLGPRRASARRLQVSALRRAVERLRSSAGADGRGNEAGLDLRDADLFEANLTGASLRGADARGTVFYNARLANTVLDECNLAEADFRGSNLGGASFRDANLSGARFDGASEIPKEIADHLDAESVYSARRVSA